MSEDAQNTVRPVKSEPEVVEVTAENETQGAVKDVQPQPAPKKKFYASAIPTDKIFKMVTDPQMMKQAWKDETMEPHLHLLKLLAIVLVLALIISLLGL